MSTTAPPSSLDLRHHLRAVQDQGGRATCLSFVATAAHEFARALPNSVQPEDDLAEEVLHWGSKQLDGGRRGGTTFLAAHSALRQWGQPPESFWPYDERRDESATGYDPPLDAIDKLNCYRAGLKRIRADIQAIKISIADSQPVLLGIPIYTSFYTPTDGVISIPSGGEAQMGGHAVLVVGYDDQPGKGLVIRNSWGDGWGDNGHAYLPYGYINNFTCDVWVLEI